MNRKIKLIIGALSLMFASYAIAHGQIVKDSLHHGKVTTGIDGETSIGGFDEHGNYTVQFNLNASLYTSPEKKGFNISAFGTGMVTKTNPVWSFFGLSFGYRFNFPVRNDCPYFSYLNIGVGAGIQSMKPSFLDTATNRLIEEAPMRGMGFVDGCIPLRLGRTKYYPLMFQLGTNISFAQANADFTYNYRAMCVLQVTNSPNDINFAVGIHCEKMLTNGVTGRFILDRGRVQIYGIFGRNFVHDSWSGAGGVQVRF